MNFIFKVLDMVAEMFSTIKTFHMKFFCIVDLIWKLYQYISICCYWEMIEIINDPGYEYTAACSCA